MEFKILRLLVLICLVLLVSGCVENVQSPRKPYPAEPFYQEVLRNWRGHSLNKLVKEWGFPQETYSTKDIKYIVYRFASWWREKPSYLPRWVVACVYTWEVSRKTDIILRGKAEGFGCPIYKEDADTMDTKIWTPENRNVLTDTSDSV